MPCSVIPMTPLMELRDTEEMSSNPHVLLINKNVERSTYLCVQRKKRQEILKLKRKASPNLLNCLMTQTQKATLREAWFLCRSFSEV